MLPLQPLRSHARANPMNRPWAWRSSANRIAPRLCRFVAPGNPDSNLPGTALVRRAELRGLKVAIGFGQTEASPYLTHTLPDDPHPDWVSTVGRPMPQTEIKIINPESGLTVPLGEIGEICARGYSVMKDYFDNPDTTRPVLDSDTCHPPVLLASLASPTQCA